MANTGELSLKIVANMEGFLGGMDKTLKAVDAFGNKVVGMAKSIARPFEQVSATLNGMTAKIKGIGGIVSGVMNSFTNIPGLGGAGSALQSFFSFFTDADSKFSQIGKIGKLSDRLGVSTEFLSGLAGAGFDVDELEKSFRYLARTMSHTHMTGDEVVGGLEKFGLVTDDLRRMSPEKQIDALGEAFKRMSAQQKTAFGMTVGGRDAATMTRLLAMGPEGIKKVLEQQKGFGNVFSRADASAIEQGQKAIKEIGQVFDGMKAQLAIGIAPYISAIGITLSDWVKQAGGIAPLFKNIGAIAGEIAMTIADGVVRVGEAITQAVDIMGTAQKVLDAFQGGRKGEEARTSLGKGAWNFFADTALNNADLTFQRKGAPDWMKFDEGGGGPSGEDWMMDMVRKGMEKARKEAARDDLKSTMRKNLDKVFQTAKDTEEKMARLRLYPSLAADEADLLRMRDTITKTHADLDKQLDLSEAKMEATFAAKGRHAPAGMEGKAYDIIKDIERAEKLLESARENYLKILREHGGAQEFNEVLKKAGDQFEGAKAQIEALQDALEKLDQIAFNNRLKKLAEDGKKVFEDMMTPLEKSNKRLDDLDDQFFAGAISLETYRRAAGKAQTDLGGAKEDRTPKAVARGSADAFSIINRFQNQGEEGNPQRRLEQKMAANIEAVLAGVRETKRLADGLLNPLKDILAN